MKEKNVIPRYPNTNASTAYAITWKAMEVTVFACGDRLYQLY